MGYVIGIIIMALLLSVYVISYVYNEKTPRPQTSEDKYHEAASCTACGSISKFDVPQEVLDQFKEDNL